MAFTANTGLTANVNNGKLEYSYTDSSKKTNMGSDLGYDQFLQLLCAEMQYQDPLEPTSNTDYVAQLATFSQLEATLEQTNLAQGNLANNLVGKNVVLKVENEATGSVNTVEGKVDYVYYENGQTYLSVNDGLYPIDSLDTVADDEYYEGVTLAKNFGKMVALLPALDNITSTYKGAVEQLRELYDGLTDSQKKLISEDDVRTMEKVEARVKELVAAEEASKKEQEAAEETAAKESDSSETL